MKYPCKDCPNRHTACWDACEAYQEARKRNNYYNAAKRKDNEAAYLIYAAFKQRKDVC